MVTIQPFQASDDPALFAILENEGNEWQDYWKGSGKETYRKALLKSVCYVLYENETLCG